MSSRPAVSLGSLWFAASLLFVVGCNGIVDDDAAMFDEVGAVEDAVPAIGCDRQTITDEGDDLVGGFVVQDGALVGLCFGEADSRIEDAWEELLAIAPAVDLVDVGLLAGFDEPDGETLAFVAPLGEDNELFVVAVNLGMADDDPEEFRLTLAHEIAHVFSQTPDQLDIFADPDNCPTFHNGNGCFLRDSYVARWVEAFWSDRELRSVPDLTANDEVGADDRCDLNPSFLGVYAASHPEEDFAESFSAFVFDLDVPPSVRPKLEFFEEFPELAAFREHVAAGGMNSPPNNFERCG